MVDWKLPYTTSSIAGVVSPARMASGCISPKDRKQAPVGSFHSMAVAGIGRDYRECIEAVCALRLIPRLIQQGLRNRSRSTG